MKLNEIAIQSSLTEIGVAMVLTGKFLQIETVTLAVFNATRSLPQSFEV